MLIKSIFMEKCAQKRLGRGLSEKVWEKMRCEEGAKLPRKPLQGRGAGRGLTEDEWLVLRCEEGAKLKEKPLRRNKLKMLKESAFGAGKSDAFRDFIIGNFGVNHVNK